MITGKTKVFGVIADPIDHVRAPMVFNPVFEEQGIDAVLVPIHLKPEYLSAQMKALALMPNMGGVCVTIPFKMDVAALCDELGLAAQMTGAVNAVRFEDGRMIGDNFDGEGFTAGLIGEGYSLDGKSVLMIGAGGAARAIAAAVSAQPVKTLGIANRTSSKVEEIKAMINHPSAGHAMLRLLTTARLMKLLVIMISSSTPPALGCMKWMPCHAVLSMCVVTR